MAIDHNAVTAYHDRLVDRLRPGRIEVVRSVYESILFYLGIQWIRFDSLLRGFREINTSSRTPRPVVNKFAARLGDCISMLASIEPNLVCAPGTDSDNDRITAEKGKDVLAWLEREVDMERVRNNLAYTVSITNNAYAIAEFDPEGGEVERIPRFECTNDDCEGDDDKTYDAAEAHENGMKCPECGEPLSASDDDADELPSGKFNVSVETPFSIWLDYTIENMEDQPVVMWRRMRTLEWVHERYPKYAADEFGPDGDSYGVVGDLGLTYLQNVIRLTPRAASLFGSSARFRNAVVIDDIYVKPCAKFPDGLWARLTAKGTVLEAKKLPFHTGTEDEPGVPIIPIAHFRYDYVPNAHLATGPAERLKSLQRERNRLVAHMQLYAARSANGMIYLPEGIDISQMEGIEGVVLRGQTTTAGGGAPKRIEPGRLSEYFQSRLTEIDAEMADITSIKDPLEQAPRIDSGYAIKIVEQMRQQRLSPVFRRWGRSYAELGTILFHLFRNFAPDRAYHKVFGETARWSVKHLKAADLRGGVDIYVESGSMTPKTLVERQAALEQALQLGVANPQDPKVKLALARSLGVTDMVQDLTADDEEIAREQQATVEWARQFYDMDTGQPLPGVDLQAASSFPIIPDDQLDNHPLHIERHRLWMLSEDFAALPPAVQSSFRTAHYMKHVMDAQMQAMGMPQLPGLGVPAPMSATTPAPGVPMSQGPTLGGGSAGPPGMGGPGAGGPPGGPGRVGPAMGAANARGAGTTGREARRPV